MSNNISDPTENDNSMPKSNIKYVVSSPIAFNSRRNQKNNYISKSWHGPNQTVKRFDYSDNQFYHKNQYNKPRSESTHRNYRIPKESNYRTRVNQPRIATLPESSDQNIMVKQPLDSTNQFISIQKKPYDAMTNCKSAGVIPYTVINGTIYFLLQRALNPLRKKDYGWNDFGGKRNDHIESTAEAAAREFSEETSCLFYLKANPDLHSEEEYKLLCNNENLNYDSQTVELLKKLIMQSQQFYTNKITEFVLPLFVSSKETYISYFVRVDYIPETDLPIAEDLHIPYETRYLRECRWFSLEELMNLDEREFHKRLQITRIQHRVHSYYEKELFN